MDASTGSGAYFAARTVTGHRHVGNRRCDELSNVTNAPAHLINGPMRMARAQLLRFVTGIALLVACVPAAPLRALDPNTGINQYAFQAWTYRNGLPASTISAIAQDANGYLWLGTSLGLVRFDGTQFTQTNAGTRTRQRQSAVRAVAVATDESIWVGFRGQGVARILHGNVTLYDSQDGAPPGSTTLIVEDGQKAIWAGSNRGLAVFHEGRWHPVATPKEDSEITALFKDQRGRMWVATPRRLFMYANDWSTFVAIDAPEGVTGIVEDRAGHLWVATSQALLTRIHDESDPTDRPPAVLRVPRPAGVTAIVTRALRDAAGNIWLATAGDGLFRVTDPGRDQAPIIDRIKEASGLISNTVLSLLEDKENDLWVATLHGLNRLADTAVITPDSVAGHASVRAVTSNRDGSVWIATNEGVAHLGAEGTRERFSNEGLGLSGVLALHSDRHGTLWVASESAVTHVTNGTVRPVPLSRAFERILSVTTDANGALWIADEEQGVFRWANNVLSEMPMPTGAREPGVALADKRGDVWIGFHSGGVARYRNGQIQGYFEDQTLVGVMTVFEDREGRIWVGTSSGVAQFKDDALLVVPAGDRIPLRYVLTITQDSEGYLWIGTTAGLLRIDAAEFEKAAASPGYQPTFRLVDSWEGLPGSPGGRGSPRSANGPDGSAWFTLANGLVAVNPHRLKPRRLSPPVQIEQLVADGQPFERGGEETTLPARPKMVQFAYTAVNFNGPTKLLFRYRLDGYDQNWHFGTAGQVATYTNLPPGKYRFQVTANVPGDAHERNATWSFTVRPALYQTSWFYLILAGIIAAITEAIWLLRTRQIKLRFAAVLSERTRVAREIHDTTLQNLGGLALEFDNLSSQAQAMPELKSNMDSIRRHVEDCIRETRQAVWDLRSPLHIELDLPAMLRQHAKGLIAGRNIDFDLVVSGTPATLSDEKKEQLARIAQEALTNAVRHSHAKRIRAELSFEDGITLSISDNGTGFSLNETDGRDAAHWGLVGMYERAARIGASLRVKSAPELGTEVRVFVP